MARKDAAFEAYKALHLAGLVNENLLPFREALDDQAAEFQIPDNTPSLVEVSSTLDPWQMIARYQERNPQSYHRTLLALKGFSQEPFYMVLLTPVQMPEVPSTLLYWNESKRFSVESSRLSDAVLTEEEIHVMRAITRKILLSVFHSRMQEERYDFLWLLVPGDLSKPVWSHPQLASWDSATTGKQAASYLMRNNVDDITRWGLVTVEGDQRKYMPKSISPDSQPPGLNPGPHLQVTRTPRRRDFLHPVLDSKHGNEAYTRTEELLSSKCLVDNLPAIYSVFALLVPSVLSRFEVYMIADTLRTTLLASISISSRDLPLLVRALTSSATGEEENYQRLEFLGDCMLKYIATVHLMADNLTWPESFLTGKKGKVVSNGFLARATMSASLDKFIITRRFTGAKWAPRYAVEVLSPQSESERQMRSSKLLADVIESLIGASYILGGFAKAFACVQTLLPLEKWTPIPDANTILFEAAPADTEITTPSILESLIGYTFCKKMLLSEALTHASYTGPHANCSYERLEFLGDAVLDYIISKRLYEHTPDLSHQKMHAMRSAMANAAWYKAQEQIMIELVLTCV